MKQALKKPRIGRNVEVDIAAKVPRSCTVEGNTRILGEVELGDKVWIAANVHLYGPCKIGQDTYIGENTVVGYPTRKQLTLKKVTASLRGKESVKIGRNVTIRTNCVIYAGAKLGDLVELGHNVLLRERTELGTRVLVGSSAVLDGYCKVGDGVSIQTGVYISPYTKIGTNSFLGPRCVLLNDKYMKQKKYLLRGPSIGSGVSIGGNSVIMPEVNIGDGAVVGAGAIVTRHVKARTIAVGNPARELGAVPAAWGIKPG